MYDEFYKWSLRLEDGSFNEAIDVEGVNDNCFEYFESIYDQHYGSIEKEDNLIAIHTGGWSDNETAIYYLKNTIWWMMYFVAEFSGGHYYFDLDKMNSELNHWKVSKVKG